MKISGWIGVVLAVITTCAPVESKAQSPTQEPIDHFDELTLKRTICFGNCPIYKVVVRGDGSVNYSGIDYVKVIGPATAMLTKAQLGELVRAINEVKYFSLRDTYRWSKDGCPMVWTDNPSAITSVVVGDRTKTIEHDYGCEEKWVPGTPSVVYPRALTEFEQKIDDIVGTARWVGTERERVQAAP